MMEEKKEALEIIISASKISLRTMESEKMTQERWNQYYDLIITEIEAMKVFDGQK